MAPLAERHELTDAQWERIATLFPPREGRGRPSNDPRLCLNGVLWILRTGAPWRDLPGRYGKFTSVHGTFTRWRLEGTLDRVLRRLRRELVGAGLLDEELWCIDGSSVRAARAAAGAKKKGVLETSRSTTRSVVREAASARRSI